MTDRPAAPLVALVTNSTRARGGVAQTLALGEAMHALGQDVLIVGLGDPAAGFFRPVQAPTFVVRPPVSPVGWRRRSLPTSMRSRLPDAVHDVVLTDSEGRGLGSSATAGVEARLHLSAKEAYYKWFRSIGRDDPVGFADMEVQVDPIAHALCFYPRDPSDGPHPSAGSR